MRDISKWIYARDHYSGECATLRKITHYLIRKGVGETLEAFQERVALADYTPYFSHIVDSLAGMMFGVEVDANRSFGALGEEKDLTSAAGRLWVDADGDRNAWTTLWKILTVELIAIHDAWIFVDGGTTPGQPRVRVLPAEAVTNWRYESGVLVEAVIREIVDTRASLQDDPKKTAAQYLYLTTEGWQRWRKVSVDDNPTKAAQPGDTATPAREIAVPIDETPIPWTYETVAGRPTIPLIPISLPLRRHVGFMLARKANAIFNKESERDHLLRFGSFPLLLVHGTDAQYKKVTDMLKKGARAIQVAAGAQPHSFIAPQVAPAQLLGDAIEKKAAAMYTTGFREYAQAGQRSQGNAKTATEVKYDLATGIAAFLIMLKSAVDDAENSTLFFLEQTLFPQDAGKWRKAHVERSDDFVPFDINDVLERLRTRYFGTNATVPVGRSARIAAAKEVAAWDDLPVDEQEIAADVDMTALFAALATLQFLDPSLPAEAKVEMVIRFLSAMGYVDPDDHVVGPDGQPTDELVVDKMRAAALTMAKKEDKNQQPPGTPGGPPFPPKPAGGPPKPGGAPKSPQPPKPPGQNKGPVKFGKGQPQPSPKAKGGP